MQKAKIKSSKSEKHLNHFEKVDPILFAAALEVMAKFGQITLDAIVEDHFPALCDHIISQQLSIKASETILNRFIDLFPDRKITPEVTLEFSDEKLRTTGFSRAKVGYIKDLAQRIVDGSVALDQFEKMDDKTIKTELVKVKGIGPWTAEMFLISNLGRPDVFSIGDLGLRNAMKKLYNLDSPKDSELIAIAEKWRPYRSYACRILWHSLSL